MTKEVINQNRKIFISELRSGKYKKGCIKSDKKGNPIFESDMDKEGACTCGILLALFPDLKSRTPFLNLNYSRKAVGITRRDCDYIQQELNDSPLSFNEIADRIETELFNYYGRK